MINRAQVAAEYGLGPSQLQPFGDSILRDDLSEVGLFSLQRPFEGLILAHLDLKGSLSTSVFPEQGVRVLGNGHFEAGASNLLAHMIETDALDFLLDDNED